MRAVLAWVRTNVFSVIFFTLMVVALVTLPIVSRWLNTGVQETVSERVSDYNSLAKLEKTKVTIANPVTGESIDESVLVNENLLRRYEEVTKAAQEDAERVQAAAVAHNQKDHTVILPELFPEPPPAEREVLPKRFHDLLMEKYEELLEQVNAGAPPSAQEMQEALARQRSQYLSGHLGKDEDDPLEPAEAEQLRNAMTKQRTTLYAARHDQFGMYATIEALRVPVWVQAHRPSMAELFEWQWQYWVTKDLLLALKDANGALSVQTAPVKRVLDLVLYQEAYVAAAGSSSGGSGFGTGGRGKPDAKPTAKAPNPATEIRPNYARSFTGRETNSLYDVRVVRLDLVVETARLLEVLDALARRNFITVLDVDYVPEDQYLAAAQGYFYGAEPVSRVSLEIESVWLREWTSRYMPPEVRDALGVPAPKPAAGG